MNGIHDLGGMHGLVLINPEKSEPVFHEKFANRCRSRPMMTLSSTSRGKRAPSPSLCA